MQNRYTGPSLKFLYMLYIFILCMYLYFWWYWGLNSGLHAYEAGILLLEPCLELSHLIILRLSAYFRRHQLIFCFIKMMALRLKSVKTILSKCLWKIAMQNSYIFTLRFLPWASTPKLISKQNHECHTSQQNPLLSISMILLKLYYIYVCIYIYIIISTIIICNHIDVQIYII
jgi:hypothetical protein